MSGENDLKTRFAAPGKADPDKNLLSKFMRQSPVSNPSQSCSTKAVNDTPINALLVGVFLGFDSLGMVQVEVAGLAESLICARVMCPLDQLIPHIQCVLMFEKGAREHAVVMGTLQQPVINLAMGSNALVKQSKDGVEIKSDKKIHLHCGDTHLIMTADGRIELRGTTVVTHSTGLNRIRGASVKIN